MINRIETINKFGIFKNFTWNSADIKDFNYKNIFYGWNYSGKTTLSRIFSSLRDRKIHESYSKSSFKVKTVNGEFDSNNLESFPYNLLVFNSDYIKDNLSFSNKNDTNTESNVILFEVGDNAIYEKKIEELTKQIELINGTDKIIGKKDKHKKDIEEFEIFDKPNSGKFTLVAKEIKDEHFISLINFTKTNLKPIISNITTNLDSFIIKNKTTIKLISEIIKIEKPKDVIDNIQINFNYVDLSSKLNELLNDIPEKNIIINILDKNPEAYYWVQKGMELNKAKEKCIFCDNIIKEDRFNLLNEYFENQAAILRDKANGLKKLIIDEENSLKIINFPSSGNDFNPGFINEYLRLKKDIDKLLIQYKGHLKTLTPKLDTKISKSLYSKVENVKFFDIEKLINKISAINLLIQKNNDFTIDFNNKISLERTKFLNHLVATFLKREKYMLKEKRYSKAIREIEKLNKRVIAYENEIERYNSLKESDKEGAQQYNYFIQSFLDRTDIEIKLDQGTKKFILLRENESASNLSEGEKSAIAFSHFLVTIKSLESKKKFSDYIVFIDDPISSLDGNHIFQINSLLKEMFFYKDNSDNELKIKCKQLFLSSHNFEFFNLLKELPINIKKESRYFIERINNKNSALIKNLPEIFDKYSSEYHFLFKEIFDFNKLRKPLNSDKLLIIPNILRRFLEMYTLTKYPSKENVDRRADIVFKPEISKRICKPFHYFSHLDNIDRIGKQSEFMADIPIACKTLINHIKLKDKKHYEALVNAVNN